MQALARRGAAAVRGAPLLPVRWACACAAGGAPPRPLAGTAPTYDVHFLVQLPPGGASMVPKGAKERKGDGEGGEAGAEAPSPAAPPPAAGGGPSASPFDPGWPRVVEGTPMALAVLSGIAQHAADYRARRKASGQGSAGGGEGREGEASSAKGDVRTSSSSFTSSSSLSVSPLPTRPPLTSLLPTFKLTAYHFPPRSLASSFLPPPPEEGHANLIVLPHGDVYASLTPDSLFSVVSYVAESARRAAVGDDDRLPEAVTSRPFPRAPFGPSSTLSPRALLMMVCVHGTRDARCGSKGGGAADALEREAKRAQARLQGELEANGGGAGKARRGAPGGNASPRGTGARPFRGADGPARGLRAPLASLASCAPLSSASSGSPPARRFNRSPPRPFASPSPPRLFPRGHTRRPVLGRPRPLGEAGEGDEGRGSGRGGEESDADRGPGPTGRGLLEKAFARSRASNSSVFAEIPTKYARGEDGRTEPGFGEAASPAPSAPSALRRPPRARAPASSGAEAPSGPPQLAVLGVSHVGGHKYAGNVIVSCPAHPCDGDWFGHVEAGNATDFLNALLTSEIGSRGGVEDPRLRELWRGRAGLDKETQQELYHIFRTA